MNYQQLLAEVYDENAKNLLVHQTEYDDEEQPPYEEYDYEENELPEADEFNKFHGDRNKPEHVIQPTPDGKGKADLNHKTNVRTIVLNIDGAFRGNIVPNINTNCDGTVNENTLGSISTSQPQLLHSANNISTLVLPSGGTNPIILGGASQGTLGSWFIFNASQIYKNITSVKLTSLEFFNSFYTFSFSRQNTYFYVTYQTIQYLIVIPDGNYLSYTSFALAIESALNNPYTYVQTPSLASDLISTTYPTPTPVFTVTYDLIGHNLLISGVQCTITFPSSQTNPYGNGIGYNMGFLNKSYVIGPQALSGGVSLVILGSDQCPDIVQDTYVYLQINDWNLVEHQIYGQTFFSVFVKIPLNTAKNTILYDNNYLNSSTKEYVFQQPTNLQKFTIKMTDAYGNALDLRGASFSMTIELQQVNNSAVYEKLLEL